MSGRGRVSGRAGSRRALFRCLPLTAAHRLHVRCLGDWENIIRETDIRSSAGPDTRGGGRGGGGGAAAGPGGYPPQARARIHGY